MALDITVAPLGRGVDLACWTPPCSGAFVVFEGPGAALADIEEAVRDHEENFHGG